MCRDGSRRLTALASHPFQAFPKKLVAFSTWIDQTRWARNTWAMLAIFILVMANVVDMVSLLRSRWHTKSCLHQDTGQSATQPPARAAQPDDRVFPRHPGSSLSPVARERSLVCPRES